MKRPTIPGVGARGTPPRKGDEADSTRKDVHAVPGSRGAPRVRQSFQDETGARSAPVGSARTARTDALRRDKSSRDDSLRSGEESGRMRLSRSPESRLLDNLLRAEKTRRNTNPLPGQTSSGVVKPSHPANQNLPRRESKSKPGGDDSTAQVGDAGAAPIARTDVASRTAAAETAAAAAADPTVTFSPAALEPEPVSGRFTVWWQLRRARAALRRVEHDEVRRFTRRARLRRRMVWGTVAGVVLVIGGLLIALFSPAMSLKTIQIQGGDAGVQQAVRQGLSAQIGRPLPLVSMSKVDSVVQGQARVLSYTTRIEPPSTISISLVLRTPLAVVQEGTDWSVVDAAGVVLSTSATQAAGLPTLTFGGNVRDPKASSSFLAAAEVLSALPASLRATVSSASAGSADSVVLTGSGGASYIFGGTNNVAYKAQVLAALLKAAPGQAIYDVSSPDAPVTN